MNEVLFKLNANSETNEKIIYAKNIITQIKNNIFLNLKTPKLDIHNQRKYMSLVVSLLYFSFLCIQSFLFDLLMLIISNSVYGF